MRPFLAFLICLLLTTQIYSQNFKQQFSDLLQQKDTIGQKELLHKWELASPNDAELFVAYFNYFFIKSKHSAIRIKKEPTSSQNIELTGSLGNKAGYLSEEIVYMNDDLQKGLYYIDSGINKYPTRLDMRFGKIYVLGETQNYTAFTNEIIRTIHFSKAIDHKWTWTFNKILDNPETVFLNAIQDYSVQIYEVGDDQLDHMRAISETILKYFPDHVPALSNIAITHSLQGNDDKALETLLIAENLAPQDYIILNNIANIYKNRGDKKNAIKYYELTLKYGDEEVKKAAKQKIKELKNR